MSENGHSPTPNGDLMANGHGKPNGHCNGTTTNGHHHVGEMMNNCGTPRRSPKANTQDRLFGGDEANGCSTPRKGKLNPTYQSTIFANGEAIAPPRTPKKTIQVQERNPITGEIKRPAPLSV